MRSSARSSKLYFYCSSYSLGVSAEKPASHKYVVAKGINTFSACFDNPRYSIIAAAQKSTSDLFLKSYGRLYVLDDFPSLPVAKRY
ncbi:hypothetical protein ROHU_008652 [Labeo rohita]|uniref:Uncharacterized protein n=1 Tax=Labeo rohita TaxID=84645 RepID=A0A498M5B7_LABRO|nr:hypothetical protein ROHU_008652 [Labeo rohita]